MQLLFKPQDQFKSLFEVRRCFLWGLRTDWSLIVPPVCRHYTTTSHTTYDFRHTLYIQHFSLLYRVNTITLLSYNFNTSPKCVPDAKTPSQCNFQKVPGRIPTVGSKQSEHVEWCQTASEPLGLQLWAARLLDKQVSGVEYGTVSFREQSKIWQWAKRKKGN